MRIIELRASNFARIVAVEIRPNGPVVPITGANDQGKSTMLRAIWTALEGRAVAPARPIRDGAEKAMMKLGLGPIAITRTFARGKHGDITTSLTVLDEDGAPVRKTPQALIDALLGDLSFDPLAFARLKPQDQFDRLRGLVPDVDFDALAVQRKKHFDERTDRNREMTVAAARLSAVVLPPGPEPAAVDVEAVFKAMHEAQQANARRDSVLDT